MANKQSSIGSTLQGGLLDDVLRRTLSNEAQLQVLSTFQKSVDKFHSTLKKSLLHRNELLETMTEREIMEAARVNHRQTQIVFSHFEDLFSLDDERLWLPPARMMTRLAKEAGQQSSASTNYYSRHLLVTDEEIDADINDFDLTPDICSSHHVTLHSAEITCVDDSAVHSRLLRKEFVLNALRLMPHLSEFIVTSNYSLVGLPTSLMHVVGQTLTTIDVSFNQLTSLPYSFLFKATGASDASGYAPAFPALERLIANNNRIGPLVPMDLFKVGFAPRLRCVNLENNHIVGFTSILLSAVKRGVLQEFECGNNDFSDEDADYSNVVSAIHRACEVHTHVSSSFELYSSSAVDDIVASKFPISFSAVGVLEELVSEYFGLLRAGLAVRASLMCPRCSVCGTELPRLWREFSEKYSHKSSELPDNEPSFFDRDDQDVPVAQCSLRDSAIYLSAASYWARQVVGDQYVDHSGLAHESFLESPPIPLYRHYSILGNSQMPIIFYTCGGPACVDDVVDIVSGDEDALVDYRKLKYEDTHDESEFSECSSD